MIPRRMNTLALILGIASVIAFAIGVVLLGAGMMLGSRGGGGARGGSLFSADGPARPGYEDGRPVGLYLMTRFWSGTGSLEKKAFYFTRDGRVYVDPQDGFSDEKLAQGAQQEGTVKVAGNEMTITWSDGKSSTSEVEKDGRSFTWDMGIFVPVEPFEDSSGLAGRWEGGHSSSLGGSSGTTSQTLELREDGTFTGAAAASLRSESDESVATAGSAGKTSGKWTLDGYSLVLTYDDGTVARGIAFPYDDEKTPANPDWFYFGGTMYRQLGPELHAERPPA